MAITLDGTNGITSPDFEPSSSTTPTNGLFLPTTNALGFATNSTERLRLDASGNLGLGVTPSGWSSFRAIDVVGGASFASYTPSASAQFTSNCYYDGSNWLYKTSTYASRQVQVSGQHQWFNAPSGTAGAAISFTQAMTLDASGNLGIGTTSPAARLHVSSTFAVPVQITSNQATTYIQVNNLSDAAGIASTGQNLLFFTSSVGTERARIDSSGNLLVGTTTAGGTPLALRNPATSAGKQWYVGPYSNNSFLVYNQSSVGVYVTDGGTSWTASSDERLKTDLKPIENATQKVLTLRAVTGRFKTDEEGVSRSFLIAQDVQAVLPEAVDSEDPEKLGVRYTETIPLLVAAIKELTARLEALENK